jgi:hypothetical protein
MAHVVSVTGNGTFARSVGGEARSREMSGIADAIAIGTAGVEDAEVMVDAGGDAVGADISWIKAVFFCLFDFEEEDTRDRGRLR